MNAKKIINAANSTKMPNQVIDVGHFSGLWDLKDFKNPVVASTTDGVGSKIDLAKQKGGLRVIGHDIVSHNINDLLCVGASPLFLLDFIAVSSAEQEAIDELIKSIVFYCKKYGISLLGGETEIVEKKNVLSVIGAAFGGVERGSEITGEAIKEGDTLIGLPSTGIHTNGYNAAKKALIKSDLNEKAMYKWLMQMHKCYLEEFQKSRKYLNGLAHITGGGIEENLYRIIPKNLKAEISYDWKIPAMFQKIQKYGKYSDEEMFKIFNMGIGMIFVVSKKDADVVKQLSGGKVIGSIVG